MLRSGENTIRIPTNPSSVPTILKKSSRSLTRKKCENTATQSGNAQNKNAPDRARDELLPPVRERERNGKRQDPEREVDLPRVRGEGNRQLAHPDNAVEYRRGHDKSDPSGEEWRHRTQADLDGQPCRSPDRTDDGEAQPCEKSIAHVCITQFGGKSIPWPSRCITRTCSRAVRARSCHHASSHAP